MHSHEVTVEGFFKPESVLILVLMEDALAHSVCCHMVGGGMVLILVLMEDALALALIVGAVFNAASLNPCFNGRCTRTLGHL